MLRRLRCRLLRPLAGEGLELQPAGARTSGTRVLRDDAHYHGGCPAAIERRRGPDHEVRPIPRQHRSSAAASPASALTGEERGNRRPRRACQARQAAPRRGERRRTPLQAPQRRAAAVDVLPRCGVSTKPMFALLTRIPSRPSSIDNALDGLKRMPWLATRPGRPGQDSGRRAH